MTAYWIDIRSLPPEGRNFTVDDPTVWSVPMAEFDLNCTVRRPLCGEVTLLPQEDGCLARGRLTGEVALPCNRCAEDAVVLVDSRFESFEPYPVPAEGSREKDETALETDDELVMRLNNGAPELNLAGLLWEEFSLALPVKPLCRPECAGLCPICGGNLNETRCACAREEGDPRLATLRGLVISDK